MSLEFSRLGRLKRMFSRALSTMGRALAVTAVPLAAVAVFAGAASADAGQSAATPVVAQSISGIPLEDVTTDPGAQYPDPVMNGAAAGAAIGSATGSFIDPFPTLLGAVIGGAVGQQRPDLVPQVLP
ncbi:glycine zipper domain-containing protein [Nocardia nova]|nr:glycine zipper domain-containing protein [Nocardia nova]